MKRLFILAIAFLLVAQVGPLVSYAEEPPTSGQCGDDVWWKFDEVTDTLTIYGKGPMWDSLDWNHIVVTPYHHLPVYHVVIEEGITQIGEYAFWKMDVITVSLPESLEHIDTGAFGGCMSLKEIIIPKNVRGIGSWAFISCRELNDIVIPEKVQTIGRLAFFNTALSSVYIPEHVRGIAPAAFSGRNLVEYQVDPNNDQYCSYGGVLFTKDMKTLVAYPIGSKAKHYEVPETVEIIEEYAFCTIQGPLGSFPFPGDSEPSFFPGELESLPFPECYLETISFPDSLRLIGSFAFLAQNALRDIQVPRNLEIWDYSSFFGIHSFARVEIPTAVRYFRGVFFYATEPVYEVYFLGAPPPIWGSLSQGEVTLYYPVALADAWAPNGEITYKGYNIAPYSYERGDANGDGQVNTADAAAILRYLVRLQFLSEQGMINANVTDCATITAADAAKILRYLVRLEPTL